MRFLKQICFLESFRSGEQFVINKKLEKRNTALKPFGKLLDRSKKKRTSCVSENF